MFSLKNVFSAIQIFVIFCAADIFAFLIDSCRAVFSQENRDDMGSEGLGG